MNNMMNTAQLFRNLTVVFTIGSDRSLYKIFDYDNAKIELIGYPNGSIKIVDYNHVREASCSELLIGYRIMTE